MSIVSTVLVKDYDVLFLTIDHSVEQKYSNIEALVNRQFDKFSTDCLEHIHSMLFANFLDEKGKLSLSCENDKLVFKFIEDLERESMSRVDYS